MISVSSLSREFSVRRLTESDVEAIFNLFQENTLYYQYCKAKPTKEQILNDLHI